MRWGEGWQETGRVYCHREKGKTAAKIRVAHIP